MDRAIKPRLHFPDPCAHALAAAVCRATESAWSDINLLQPWRHRRRRLDRKRLYWRIRNRQDQMHAEIAEACQNVLAHQQKIIDGLMQLSIDRESLTVRPLLVLRDPLPPA